MNILVLGASGFIGSVFCSHAVSQGENILGLVRNKHILNKLGFNRISGSIENPPWKEIIEFKPDVVINFAWDVNAGNWKDSIAPENYISKYSDLFTKLLNSGVSKIIGIGSALEYSPTSVPVDENCATITADISYVKTKLMMLQQLKEVSNSFGRKHIWIRPFYVYGETDKNPRIIPHIFQKLRNNEIVFFKNPQSTKDFINVADVASAVLVTAKNDDIEGVVNVGTGVGTKILDLALKIASLLNVDKSLIKYDSAHNGDDTHPFLVADNKKLLSLGWQQNVTLLDGLKKM
jgi:nucleoside-diphosphate-sugar epimerase